MLVELLTHPQITKTFMVPTYNSPKEYEDLAEKLIAFSQMNDTKHLGYGIYREEKLIGFLNDCGIEGREIEIGYVIHPLYQGHGYATEALNALLTELRAMGFCTVRAGYFQKNIASRRVMEKCGMHPIEKTEIEEYRGEQQMCLYCEICF